MGKERSNKKRILLYFLIILILLYLFSLIVTGFMTFMEHKFTLSSDIFMGAILQTATNPVGYIIEEIQQKNPLMILGGLGIILYTGYLSIKSLSKSHSWEVSEKNTHGSAQYNTAKELTADGNYKLISYRDFYKQWQDSLKETALEEPVLK